METTQVSVPLQKGQRIDLTKGSTLAIACVGLGWNINPSHDSSAFDLDAFAVRCISKW